MIRRLFEITFSFVKPGKKTNIFFFLSRSLDQFLGMPCPPLPRPSPPPPPPPHPGPKKKQSIKVSDKIQGESIKMSTNHLGSHLYL